MKRLCAWCRRDMDTREILSEDEYKKQSKNATHGMCQECLEKQLKVEKEEVEKC
jgi:hypothetical protein